VNEPTGKAADAPAVTRPSLVARWIAFWDEREPPTVLASIRILLAAVVLADLVAIGLHGLPAWLWAPLEAGGMTSLDAERTPLFYRLMPQTASSAVVLWGGLVLSMLSFGVGCFTRASALVFVCLYIQAAAINGYGDRGIDRAIRIVMLIFVLAPSAKIWSVDAWRKTGSLRGDGAPVGAWPRYLILGQLVLIYCSAGLSKGGTHWYPWGGYDALYLVLQDPIFATSDFGWLAHPLPYAMTKLATASTHLWEISAPLVLLAAYYRRTPERGGVLRRLFNRVPFRNVYVLVGIAFHLTLAATMALGIFPFGMLALFPAFFRPEELERALARWRRVHSPGEPGGSPSGEGGPSSSVPSRRAPST
jgi:vitamin K-dependent gamma-carboxylase-like protein